MRKRKRVEGSERVEVVDLGTCCICIGTKRVVSILQLAKKAPMPGRGWGCVVCHLPCDGAVAVVCDECMLVGDDPFTRLRFVCTGYPGSDGRTPICQVVGVHEHNMDYHVGDMGEE